MGYNISKQQYSTFIINKLYTYNNNIDTKLYFNLNILSLYTSLLIIPSFNIILFNNCLLNLINHNYFFSIFFKFFQTKKAIFKVHKKRRSKLKRLYKNILFLSKFNNKRFNFHKKPIFIHYTNHQNFKNYRKLFKKTSFNLFTPFIKVKNSRKFPIFQKKHLNKSLRFFKRDSRVRYQKRYWFFLIISKLQKKIKVINYSSFLKNNYSKFLRINKKPLKKNTSFKKQRRNHLTPKQHLFLNVYRNKIKYIKSKPMKTILLKKILLFYKKKLFKTKYSKLTSKLTRKIFKYKLKSIINNKRGKKFFIKTLKTTNQFFFSKKSFFPKKRFKSSKRKHILKKKQHLTMFRYYRLFIFNKRFRNYILYFKRSRTRYFSWRYRRLTLKYHKLVRVNRFLKQNSNRNFIKTNNISFKKNLWKKVNRKAILKLYRKRKWTNNFRMLINFPKKDNVTSKVIKKKTLTKINTNVKKIKKTKKMRRFRFRFKPIHYFLKSFIKKIKKYNIRRYKSLVKYFFRVFRRNFKLFSFEKPVELDDSLVNDPSILNNVFPNKPLSLKTKVTDNVSFFKNRFINKPIVNKRRSLRRNIISKKVLIKLQEALNVERFKPLSSLSFIYQIFNKKLINYGVINYRKKSLNKLVLKKITKQLKLRFLKKFPNKLLIINKIKYNIRSGKLPIMSKYKTPFILSNLGFLFIQNININIKLKLRSKINRYKYSFFYLNDIKRFFLKKPGHFKLATSSLFSNNFNKSKFFNIKRFGNSYGSTYISNYVSKNNLLVNTSGVENFTFKDRFLYNKTFNTYTRKEVRIKRIKFKPGYSRIWRNARKAINNSLNFNLKYQYRLTRELTRLSRTKSNAHIFIKELTLLNLLFNSHFVTDIQLSKLLINSNVVFVNGILSNNDNLSLFKGDFIQIIVSLKYYIIYRWMLNWNKYKRTRLLKLAKVKFKKQGMMRDKQKSTNLPDWVLTSRIKSFDIPKYLEVDYFTLSTFVLYEPFLLNDFNPLSVVDSRIEIFNMYNWKYIN